MDATSELERWEWLDLVLSEHGPANACTRLVLCVLAAHMNQRGERCFPSQALIVKRSGLTLRAVQKHLHIAAGAGWLKVREKRRPGKSWFVNEYKAVVPKNLRDLAKEKPWASDPTWRRDRASGAGSSTNGAEHPASGAGCSSESSPKEPDEPQHPAPSAEHPARGAEHPASGAGQSLHQVHTNSPSEPPIEHPTSNVQPPNGRTTDGLLKKVKPKSEPESEAQMRAKIIKARAAFPADADEAIARMAGVPVDTVRRLQ